MNYKAQPFTKRCQNYFSRNSLSTVDDMHCFAKAPGQFRVFASNAISLHIQWVDVVCSLGCTATLWTRRWQTSINLWNFVGGSTTLQYCAIAPARNSRSSLRSIFTLLSVSRAIAGWYLFEYYALTCYQGKDLSLLSGLTSIITSVWFCYMLDQALGAVLNEDSKLCMTSNT